MKTRYGEAGMPFTRRGLLIGCASAAAATRGTTGNGLAAGTTSGVARVGGIPIYFEVHGGPLSARTTPFVLMHGGLMTIETAFAGDLLPKLSALAPTIAIESQGHGHTADRPRPMKLDLLVADVIGVLDHLRVDSAQASFERSGADASRMPELGNRINEMRGRWQRWTPEQLGSIGVPVLLGIGDHDFTRIDHAAEMARLIPSARLAVLPGTTHVGMISRGAWLVPMIQSVINS